MLIETSSLLDYLFLVAVSYFLCSVALSTIIYILFLVYKLHVGYMMQFLVGNIEFLQSYNHMPGSDNKWFLIHGMLFGQI